MKSNDRQDVVAKSYKNMPDTLSVDSVIKKTTTHTHTNTHTHQMDYCICHSILLVTICLLLSQFILKKNR